MDFSISNQTLESKTTHTVTLPQHNISTYILNIVMSVMCVIIVCCDVIGIQVIRRCKRVPYQCLQLSISYLLSEIIALIIFVIHEILIFGFDINTDVIFNSRITTVGIMTIISSASMAAIILERVVALKANLKYTLALKQIKIHVLIAIIWLAHILIFGCVGSVSFYSHCNWVLLNCNITEVNKLPKYCLTFLTVFYDVIMIVANIIIYKIARHHAVQIDVLKQTVTTDKSKYPDTVSERQYASIVVFMKIVTFYILLQTPIILAMFLGTNFPEIRDRTPMRIFRCFAYLLFLSNGFLNLYFYILKIKECRMILYFKIGKFFKKYEQKANVIRLQVYDIVVYTERVEGAHAK